MSIDHILRVFENSKIINNKEEIFMKKITEKLNLIQTKLKAPKGQYNSFGKYHYRSCEDVLEGVKPLLEETKTILTISDELVNIGDRYYIKATASLFDGEDSIEVTGFAREEESKKGMDGSQVTGASSSYARKYALNGLFAIDDTKDSDGTNKHGDDKGDSNKISESQVNLIKKLFKDKKITVAQQNKTLKDTYKVDKLEQLSKKDASAIIKKLQG